MSLQRIIQPYLERYYLEYGENEEHIADFLRACLANDGLADPALDHEAADKGYEFFYRAYYQRIRSATNRELRKAVRGGRAKIERNRQDIPHLIIERWKNTMLPLPDGIMPRRLAHEEDFRRAANFVRQQVQSMIANVAPDEAAADQLAQAKLVTGEDLSFEEADSRGLIDWNELAAA